MRPIREALKRLEAGHLLGLLPEGRLMRESRPATSSSGSGVAWLALKSKVPVIPVFIQKMHHERSP